MRALRRRTGLRSGLLYSQCWEDVAVARAALRIRPGATVLAIAAAGDNVLALLQDDPARILAVDVNPAQTALLELKMAAIKTLADDSAVAAFLGASPSLDRIETYRRIVRPALTAVSAANWDGNLRNVARGVIHAGRFERYLAAFRAVVLPLVPGRRTIRAMLAVTNLEDQRRIYRDDWDTLRWRLLFRLFFSRRLLRWFGRDPAFFDNAEIDDVGDHYLARAKHALVDIPIWENPYVTYILSGRFGTDGRLPEYLRPGAQPIIQDRLGRIDVRTTSLDEALRSLPSKSVDAFYLSDVFELSSPEGHAATLAEVARVGRPGARICYWINLVPRQHPAALATRLTPDPAEAGRLHAIDRAFLYSGLVIETVRGGAA